jgi:hypothetical protein
MKQIMRRLTPEEEEQAEQIAAKIGMPVQRMKFFMALPLNLKSWTKKALWLTLQHRSELHNVLAAKIAEELVTTIKSVTALQKEVAALRREVEAKEYQGVWACNREYAKGASVSFRGSTWIAKKTTTVMPGEDLSWQLAVKRGRDGRSAR